MDERTLADVGEFGLIDLMTPYLTSAGREGELGVGDDAAVIAVSGKHVVAAVDQMVEGRHFRRDWSSAYEVGRKAAARAMSDISAMGAVPSALLVSLAAPADTTVTWALDLMRGLADEAAVVGAHIVGGDTVEAPEVVISVTALGDAGKYGPVLRSGAQPGDRVFIAGTLGRAAAGLAVLMRGHRQPKSLVAAQRTPEPPYAAGVAAASAGATAMIDISDGLLADAAHVARASGVVIAIERDLLAGDGEIEAMARNFGVDPWDWVLTGGEDHALLAVFPEGATPPVAFQRIGTVLSAGAGQPEVTVDGQPTSGAVGHEHFRS